MLIGLDLDGTVLDSRLRHSAALREAASAFGVCLSEEDVSAYSRLKLDGLNGLAALRQLEIAKAESISQRWSEIIENEDLLALDKLYEDVPVALQKATAAGDTFVMVTARRKQDAARKQIAALGLNAFMHEILIVDPRDASACKVAATRHHDLQAIVGDTEADLVWATTLHVEFYASSFGFRSRRYWDGRNIASYPSLSAIFDAIHSAGVP
jgi:phosphoglycolate phosphatase-like HAD superfamily hydrolase